MLSIQTCQSSNRVDFLLRGKFVKGSKKDFLLAVKDSYLELLTGDFKETICVQNTFLKIIHVQIQEGKQQDQFLVADEKLNFRILKFDGSFVETCFLGNFRSCKLKKYVEYSTLKGREKKNEFFQEYSKHIHVCKLKKVFLVSIENVIFFVTVKESNWIHKKLSNYCRNYDFRIKYISKQRNVNIIYDPMQLRHYIIHRNRNGRKRFKYISSSFSRDCKAHVYSICVCCPKAAPAQGSGKRAAVRSERATGGAPTDGCQRKKRPLGSRSKCPIKVNKIRIEKCPKKESSFIRFRKNVSFVTLLECTTEGYSNVQCGPSYAEQHSISSLNGMRSQSLFGEGGAFVGNAPNGELFGNLRGLSMLVKSSCVTSPPQGSTSDETNEAIERGMTSPLGDERVAPTHHTFHPHDEEQPCSELHIRRQHSSNEDVPMKNYYYNEFANCTNLKICFIINFIQSRSRHAYFVRHILFLLDREESAMIKLMKHLWRTKMFESNDWDVLNKYGKDIPGDEIFMSHNNYLLHPSLKWKQLYGHTKKLKGGKTERHSFEACPLCQYHIEKMKFLQGDPVFEHIFERDFFCRHGGFCNGQEEVTSSTNDALNAGDVRRVTALLFGLSIRLKLLLVYFSLFFYSSSKTLSDSSCTILLRRKNGKPSIMHELAMHIYLLNLFLVHIINYACGDLEGNSSSNAVVGKLAKGRIATEADPLSSAHAHRDKCDVTNMKEGPNGDKITNKMLLSMCQTFNRLIGEYIIDSPPRSNAGMETGVATPRSHMVETTEGETTSEISTRHCEVVKRLIIEIQNLQLISVTCLKEFNFDYGKVRDKLIRAKEKLERRCTHEHRIERKTHIILITTNDHGQANIIFFKNRRKRKNTTVNNILIPMGKLYLPMEVEKVERVMNSSSFVLFAKKGMVLFFHFSTAYGASLSLVNYRLALNSDVFVVDKMRFVRIVKRDGVYEEIQSHILCPDYFVKCISLKCLRNFPPRLWPSVAVGGWRTEKHMGRGAEGEGNRDRHLERIPLLKPRSEWSEQTEDSLPPRRHNYINSATQFHSLRSVPYIDTFYTYAFVYHYDFKVFQYMCASGSGAARMNNCICADMNTAITIVGEVSTVKGSSTYGRSDRVNARLSRGKTEPSLQLQPPRGVSSPSVHPTPVSLQISKSTFNEIYKRRKNAFFTNPQGDDPNERIATSSGAATRRGRETEERRDTIPPKKMHKRKTESSRCYLNNENDADSIGKVKWDEKNPAPEEDDALSNALIVSLGSNYPRKIHPAGNPFVKRYLSVDLREKKMCVIILLFDMVQCQMFIKRTLFGRGSPSTQGQESNHFKNIIASSKGMWCISSVGNTSVSPSKPSVTMDESTSFVLSLSEEQADQLFIIKSCVYRVSHQQQIKYIFKNVQKPYYTYERIKSVKDYKYKEKAVVSHLQNMQSRSSLTDELKKIANVCKGTAQMRGNESALRRDKSPLRADMEEDHHILSVKRLKKKMSDALLILDKHRDLHKLTLGYKVLLARSNQTIVPLENHTSTHTFMIRFNNQLSILCMTSYLKTSYFYVRCKGDLFGAFQNALSLLSVEKKKSPMEANTFTMPGRASAKTHSQGTNCPNKRMNQQNDMKKKETFEMIQEEQLESLNLTKEKVIYAKCIGQNGGSNFYVLVISKNSIIINDYYVDPLSGTPLQLVNASSWGLTSPTVVHCHFNKGILALSYVTGTVDLFYLDGVNSVCLLIDRIMCKERIHSIYIIAKEDKKGVSSNKPVNKYKYILLCIGLQRRCRVVTYYVSHSCASPLNEASPSINFIDDVPSQEKAKKNIKTHARILKGRSVEMERPGVENIQPCHPLHTFEGITKSVNPPQKSTQFVVHMYEYTVDTLNDHCTITGMIQLNNFLLLGTNEGVVKAYDIFHSSNAPTNDLFLRHCRVYKKQKTVTNMFDEFLLGNNSVYFVNPLKGHDVWEQSPRVVYQKRCRAVAFCESNMFMFVSDRVMQGGTTGVMKSAEGASRWQGVFGSDERDDGSDLRSEGGATESTSASEPGGCALKRGHNYVDEMKSRVHGYLVNLLNLEKDKVCNLLRDTKIGEGRMPSRNIFVLPLRIYKNEADPAAGGLSSSDVPNQSSHLMEAFQTDDPPSDATIRRSNEPCADRLKEAMPSHPTSSTNRELFTTNKNHVDHAWMNHRLIKVKDEMSANNIVLIKNKDRNFPYLIIISLNQKMYTGLIQRDQLLFEKRKNCKEEGSIDKFVKVDSSSPLCDYYTKNFVLYSQGRCGQRSEGGGNNDPIKFTTRHCCGNARKQEHLSVNCANCARCNKCAKCSTSDEPNKTNQFATQKRNKERGIGTHCGSNNLCLKMNKNIINTFESSSLSDVCLINLDRKYILTELFLICSSTEKGEIIEAIEGSGDRKDEGRHSSGKISGQSPEAPFSDHLARPPLELPPRRFPVKLLTNRIDLEANTNDNAANSFSIYTQLYLRDQNLFAWNKHILCLLRNQCVNFANRFYAFLFYNTISRTHQLNPFFQDRWVAKNISFTRVGSREVALDDLTVRSTPRGKDNYVLQDEEKKRELLHNCVNRICTILVALIGQKKQAVISKNLFLDPSHKKGKGKGEANGRYKGEVGENHEGDSRDICTGDAKGSGTKKKKGSGENFTCTKKQRKLGKNETVQMDQKGGPVCPSKCVDYGSSCGSPLAESTAEQIDVTPDPATNLGEFLKNVEEKEEKYLSYLRPMDLSGELSPQEGSSEQPSQNQSTVTSMLFVSLFKEVENIYKMRLLGEVPSKGIEADNVGTSTSSNARDCHLTFLAMHLKGSKYHFSSVTEYYKIVCKKNANSKAPIGTDSPEYSGNRDDRAVGEAGWRDAPRTGTRGCRNKTHKKEYTKVRRRSIHKMTHHNRRTRQRKGKLIVLASRRAASYLLKEHMALFVLYRACLRMACYSVKQLPQRVKTRKGKKETRESLKEEEKDSYDCLFVFPNNFSNQYKEIILCRLKDKVNRMFNFNEGDLFLVLKIQMNYVFLVNYRRGVSFWINIKHVYKNMLAVRLEQRPAKGGASNGGEKNEGEPPHKDKTALVFKKTKGEDILPFFIKNTTITPITYMTRGMKNVKPFQNKYIIFTQKNHIVLLKIVFAKSNRKFAQSKNGLMEKILQNCTYDKKTLLYRTQDGRTINLCDLFNELLRNQYVIKNRSSGKKGLSEVEYIEFLTNSRGRLDGAATTTTNTRGNIPNRGSNPDGRTQNTLLDVNSTHGEYLNKQQDHMMKQKEEQYMDLFKSYTFEEYFTQAEKELLYSLKYEIVEHHRNEENFENINDMHVYENKILIVTKSYVRLYQYDEQKNVMTLQCSNTFYNINNVIMNEKYRRALVLRGIFQSVNIVSKRFLSIYYVLGKSMYYIGHIKLRNKIKFIFENKLMHNVMGINMNVNQREHMVDSIRTYQKFFFNFFLVDSKCNFLSIYSSPFTEEDRQGQNYFYDHNRALQICHDLMLFLQILINGKKNGCSSPHPNDAFLNKIKSVHSKKKIKKIQRNYFYNNYFIKSKYRIFLTIFVNRFFIYMNKKIVFLENAFSQSCTDDLLFELKLRVYNRILKLSSYDFSDKKSAIQLLNEMYDMRANKNAPYFSLQTRLQDYGEIMSSELYHMKVYRSASSSCLNSNQPVQNYRPYAHIKSHAQEHSLERNIAKKIEEMNKYRFDPITDYNGVVKNNIRDNCYYDVDFYHFLDCIHNMDQGTLYKKTQIAEYKKHLKNSFADNSLFQIYFNFLTYMSNNPNMFHHMKKYLHFHPYSTKLLKNRTYYFNMDLLNVIFTFDNEALGELKSVLTLFPTSPSLDEVFTAVSLMHMPLGGS
ncbi:hypothetical protein AK88_02921 [Plasmodium fragile]|uniref:Uncharacterized protein n=2 Tax=Plasmodium fragile TaxID=5857 RepID=A0A0D9QKC8_PLAFR|nr:uncharacterized protein AK88_02921 [Plasmodium fragile]KJP87489.1 hypothetical protein AK88_02921 [Plasmodium fragile]